MRIADHWRPPLGSCETLEISVGQVIAWDYRAWEVMHLQERVELTKHGHDMRVTLRRLHGPKYEGENDIGDKAFSIRSRWSVQVYREGRVWLCSCCGHPAPCRNAIAEEEAGRSAREFEKRLARMGPGLCYGCGEVITSRQERVTFQGEHADFPGRPGPTFHTRRSCRSARASYAARAGLHFDGGPLPPPCDGHITRHGDGTYECSGTDCAGLRARHRSYSACYANGCQDPVCRSAGSFGCTPDGTEEKRA